MNENVYDVIIIGGGASGTACAALLSKKNLKVLLLEMKGNVGGRSSTLKLANGFNIDTGVHGIPYYDIGSLKKIEDALEIKIELIDYKPLLCFFDAEEEINVEVFDFTNKGFKEVDRVWGHKGQFLKLLNLLRTATPEEADSLDNISVKNYFGQFSEFHQFQQLLRAINGMITITPELGSAGEFVRSFSKLFSSKRPITYPKAGGIQSLSEMMSSLCIKQGGQILTSMKVEEILIESHRIEGVRAIQTTDNGVLVKKEFFAPVVIVTIPLQQLFEITSPDHFSPEFVKKIESLKNKQSCAQGIGVAFKETLLEDFPWNPKCWGAIIFQPGKRPRYLSVPSALVEGLAPPGYQYMFYGVVVTPEELKDKNDSKIRLKELITELNKLFPRLKQFKDWHFSGTSEMVLGTAKRVRMTGRFKPTNKCEDVEGLFFAGDTAEGDGPGLECTYDSAFKCSQKVIHWIESREKTKNLDR